MFIAQSVGMDCTILDGTRFKEYLRNGVQKGLVDNNLHVSDETEFYLVELLANFAKTESLFIQQNDRFEEEPLAVTLARAMNGDVAAQVRELKRLGDVALYISGFFHDHLKRGLVGRSYYIDMGSGAYASLAGCLSGERLFANLYKELSENFSDLAKALGELSVAEQLNNNTERLRLYERWLNTHDEEIRRKLIKEGFVL